MSFPGPPGLPPTRIYQTHGEESTHSSLSPQSRVGLGGTGPHIHTATGPPSRPDVLHGGLGNQPPIVVKPPERPAAGYSLPLVMRPQTMLTASLTQRTPLPPSTFVGNSSSTLSQHPIQSQHIPADSGVSGFQSAVSQSLARHQQYPQPPQQLSTAAGPPPTGSVAVPPATLSQAPYTQQQPTMYTPAISAPPTATPSQFSQQHQQQHQQQHPPPTAQPPPQYPSSATASIPRRPPPTEADAYGPPAASYGSSSSSSSGGGGGSSSSSSSSSGSSSGSGSGSGISSSCGGRWHNGSSRIDPTQMPRPLRQMPPDPNVPVAVFHTRSATARRVPPPVGCRYQVVDNGNCSPRHLRATTYAPPATRMVWKQTGLPMAVLATCFADVDVAGGEEAVPVVYLGAETGSSSGSVGGTSSMSMSGSSSSSSSSSGGSSVSYRPPRCQRCQGYVGPFAAWTDGGSRWTCHLCGHSNETPAWYYSSLDGAGLRLDRSTRPELVRGSVDFCVSSEDFGLRPPEAQVVAFAVDMSSSARANGSALAALVAVEGALLALESRRVAGEFSLSSSSGSGGSGSGSGSGCGATRVGIVSFDEAGVTFYLVRRRAAAGDARGRFAVSVLVVDAHDPVAALPARQWLFPAAESGSGEGEGVGSGYGEVRCIVDRLRRQCESEWTTDGSAHQSPLVQIDSQAQDGSCPAAAIRAVQLGLADAGGRLFVFAGAPRSYGFGASCRESMGVYGRSEELFLYASLDAALSLLADGADVGEAGARSRPALEQSAALAEACARSGLCVDVFVLVEDRLTSDPYAQTHTQTHAQQQQRVPSMSDKWAFRDCAALAECCDRTGGTTHYFTGCLLVRDNALRLRDQLRHCLDQMHSSEVAFKLRVSAGLRVLKYVGPGEYDPLTDQGTCAGMDRDATVGFVLGHTGGGLKDEDKVYVQLAVLYTPASLFAFSSDPQQQPLAQSQPSPSPSSLPQRRVRVHNLCLICSADPSVVFKNVDADCVVAALAKLAADRALRVPLGDVPWALSSSSSSAGGFASDISSTIMTFFSDDGAPVAKAAPAAGSSVDSLPARQYLVAVVADSLHKYRTHCAAQASRAQLILPETLRLLPLFALGLLKHPAFLNNAPTGGQHAGGGAGYGPTTSHPPLSTASSPFAIQKLAVRASERACELRRLRTLSIREVVDSLYPRMFALREVVDAHEGSARGGSDQFSGGALPPTVAASSEVFASDGLYLLDDCSCLWLVVGRTAPLPLLGALFAGFPVGDDQGAGLTVAAAVADRPRLSSSSLLLAPSDVDNAEPDRSHGHGHRDGHGSMAGVVLARLVNTLRGRSRCKQELRVVWSDEYGSPDTHRVGCRLVEDSIFGTHSYADFLAKLHSYVIAKG